MWTADMRMGHRPPLWAAAAVLLIGVVVLTVVVVVVRTGDPAPVGGTAPPPPPQLPPQPPVTVVTWNVCADTWRSCPYGGKPDALAAAVVETVHTQRADVVLLQEVCRTVLAPAAAALGPAWAVSFEPVYRASRTRKGERVKRARCADDFGDYGLAVLARRDLDASPPAVRLHPLPSPRPVNRTAVEQRLTLCVQIEGVRIQVCNAHFSIRDQDPTGALRARQADQLAQELWFGERLGYATLVGGDLNAAPGGTDQATGREVLRPLYDLATECEDADRHRPTYGSVKIDYLFAGRGFSRVGCDVVERPESDHRVLVGRFRRQTVAATPGPIQPARRGAFLGAAGTGADGGALAGALRRGAAGLAVRVHERGGAVLVGAGKADPWGRTLEASYLRPVRQWLAATEGGADRPAPFTLLVDPGPAPGRAVYEALERALRPYRDVVSRMDGGREVRAAVRIVVPDSAAVREHFAAAGRSTSFLFVEAGPASPAGNPPRLPDDAVAMVSVRLPGLTGATVDQAVLERQVRRIHQLGYLVRLSGLDPAAAGPPAGADRLWTALLDAGVDLIEVADVAALGEPPRAPDPAGVAQAD